MAKKKAGKSDRAKTKTKAKARIFLVEDHGIARLGLTRLIDQQTDMEVCGDADGVVKALEAIPRLKPALAIVDLTLKDGNGLELIKTLHAQDAALAVLVVSMHDESLMADLALHAGARGFIMKEEAIDKVLVAIRQVLSGKIYLSEKMMLRMIEGQLNRGGDGEGSSVNLLSKREREIFHLFGQWRGISEIAAELRLSIKTVESYRQRIRQKLNLASAKDLTRYATDCLQRRNGH